MNKGLIVIVGPTAAGKTSVSLSIAKQFRGEIVSGDSMQVYQEMDIGTAKVSKKEQAGIPHHLIDVCRPDKLFSVDDYKQIADQAISDIHQREAVPILVGGTGLYIESVVFGYLMPETPENPTYRMELERWAELNGNIALHQRLEAVDPIAALRIHPNNRRRVIRALEVFQQTGVPFSSQKLKKKPNYHPVVWIGVTMPRELLYDRINHRVDEMMDMGWLEEVAKLRKKGYHLSETAEKAIGYRELFQVLDHKLTLEEAIHKIKQQTRKYAKRQLTWFRRISMIKWFDMTQANALKEIQHWTAGEFNTGRE
ncbi:tRNA dimethylallyltransferase [Seinonella peptonophila]|uniref:tRNA dimethylallyltransferase n=1 Tax=Seinonella peptonophila TaxID=112248 RepID=A0A1M4T250_9BACL|nr:tRNA (adenosine(37)-N6)-dimethylallyltransferase MiaA [Seinonella peptonophila]SHE38478.1 tRNA dimethylallyltransferase [Seinonella peptonophila]